MHVPSATHVRLGGGVTEIPRRRAVKPVDEEDDTDILEDPLVCARGHVCVRKGKHGVTLHVLRRASAG